LINKRNQSKARPSASASGHSKADKKIVDVKGISLDLVRELARIAGEYNLSEVEVDPTGHVRVRRQMAGALAEVKMPGPLPALSLAPPPHVEATAEPGTFVTSPFVGTYYSAPSPEASPFVEVGQAVRKGQVVCIVEAMKLMNEIESESDGRVAEILVQNGEHVEYGQPLIRLIKG
jgi:acetyl-CoA carboxylase biotin carboxyl carrier protein